ncbi:putative restriction endonuclease [Thermus phage phiLo]|nr:putative restriction endonuclease [Thermus phage phiLo]
MSAWRGPKGKVGCASKGRRSGSPKSSTSSSRRRPSSSRRKESPPLLRPSSGSWSKGTERSGRGEKGKVMSTMGENSLTEFQNLLRTLFQFDSSDLDFGIYRILNYKRDQVEAFITERLPQIVDQAFGWVTSSPLSRGGLPPSTMDLSISRGVTSGRSSPRGLVPLHYTPTERPVEEVHVSPRLSGGAL